MALEMKYFVLKPKGDDAYARASRYAMWAYAERIRSDDAELADSLENWVRTSIEKG